MAKKSRNALSEEIIQISPGLAIYKVGASPYWQVRIRDTASLKYVVRSSKEKSRVKARIAAQELADELRRAEPRTDRHYTFEHYANRMIARAERLVTSGDRSPTYARDIKYCLRNKEWGLINVLGTKDVRSIRTREFQKSMEMIQQTRPDLSPSTRNILTATFRNVMKVARDDGIIDAVPATPRTSQRDNPRSYFPFHPLVSKDDDLYKVVLSTAKILAKEEKIVRRLPITGELYDIILFLAHSFVRPTISELYALKHSDVAVADDPPRLLLTIRNGKTGYRVANTMPNAVAVYNRIMKRYPNSEPNDYIFYPNYQNRITAARNVQRQFRVVLDTAKISNDPLRGIKYTLYSLRHTAICMRIVLSHGEVNIYNLAKNAGTSVEQIERFYARRLPLSKEMALNLQKFGSN